jgi:hypothetical protein
MEPPASTRPVELSSLLASAAGSYTNLPAPNRARPSPVRSPADAYRRRYAFGGCGNRDAGLHSGRTASEPSTGQHHQDSRSAASGSPIGGPLDRAWRLGYTYRCFTRPESHGAAQRSQQFRSHRYGRGGRWHCACRSAIPSCGHGATAAGRTRRHSRNRDTLSNSFRSRDRSGSTLTCPRSQHEAGGT